MRGIPWHDDAMAWGDIVTYCAGVATVIGAGMLIWRTFLKRIVQEACDFFGWWRKFQRDWDGEPSSPGRDAVPGVMERLNMIDGELSRNGGHSMKDQVLVVRDKIDAIDKRVDTIEMRQVELQRLLTNPPRKTTAR